MTEVNPVKSKEEKKETVWTLNVKVCQTCEFHRNNPSYCRKDKKYVNRKAKACGEYRRENR